MSILDCNVTLHCICPRFASNVFVCGNFILNRKSVRLCLNMILFSMLVIVELPVFGTFMIEYVSKRFASFFFIHRFCRDIHGYGLVKS